MKIAKYIKMMLLVPIGGLLSITPARADAACIALCVGEEILCDAVCDLMIGESGIGIVICYSGCTLAAEPCFKKCESCPTN